MVRFLEYCEVLKGGEGNAKVKQILQDELLVNIGDPKDMLSGESFKQLANG